MRVLPPASQILVDGKVVGQAISLNFPLNQANRKMKLVQFPAGQIRNWEVNTVPSMPGKKSDYRKLILKTIGSDPK